MLSSKIPRDNICLGDFLSIFFHAPQELSKMLEDLRKKRKKRKKFENEEKSKINQNIF